MSTLLPIEFTWTGDAMQPAGRFTGLCDRQFVIGERYILVEQEERSSKSHAHYFACVRDGWPDGFETVKHPLSWQGNLLATTPANIDSLPEGSSRG